MHRTSGTTGAAVTLSIVFDFSNLKRVAMQLGVLQELGVSNLAVLESHALQEARFLENCILQNTRLLKNMDS